jgi:hypothetical protein
LGVAPSPSPRGEQLDSQYVLQRYSMAIETVAAPKNVVFTYAVSQLGPVTIEQRHRIYRSGNDVRDETLAVDGAALTHKTVRISRRDDRYAVTRLAPRMVGYQMLFLRAVPDGAHLDYVYDVTPLLRQPETSVDRITIDGVRFLPRAIHFHTAGTGAHGSGEVEYAPFGPYWMPVVAAVDASVGGKPARERITWTDYRFPESLPSSTFSAPRPLPPHAPS